MTKRESVPFGDFPNNCNKIEYTADGFPIGRCWFHLVKGKCPRHGQIIEVQ